MPRDLQCDPVTGDLVTSAGDLVELDDTDSAVQDLRVRLRMLARESLLVPSAGLDINEVSSGLPLDLIAGMIRTEAEQVPGMRQVLVEPVGGASGIVDPASVGDPGSLIPADRIVSFRLRATLSLSDRVSDLQIDETITLEIT